MIVEPSTPRPRRGLATAAVLVCLFLITLISLATLRATFARRQMVRSQELSLQSEWLAAAGMGARPVSARGRRQIHR